MLGMKEPLGGNRGLQLGEDRGADGGLWMEYHEAATPSS